MLSKSATMLLGLITHQPLNAYEIVKTLDYMNIKYWFNIGTSTVYATIKTLEKKQYLVGEIQKDGNMPDKTVYSITEQGKAVFLETLRTSFLKFDYDTNIFSITAFFLQRWKFLSQIITVHNTKTFDRISRSAILPHWPDLLPFCTGSVLNYVFTHIYKNMIS